MQGTPSLRNNVVLSFLASNFVLSIVAYLAGGFEYMNI